MIGSGVMSEPRVFIMWSGDRSQRVANALHAFLRVVVQGPKYFISTGMNKGELWDNVISGELEATNIGVATLLPENIKSTWMHFEAGAVSKATAVAKVFPYLVGVSEAELAGPLSRFQATAADEGGTRDLVESLNALRPPEVRLPDSALTVAVEGQWPALEREIREALEAEPQDAPIPVGRTDEDMLREILATVRSLHRALSSSARPPLREVPPSTRGF